MNATRVPEEHVDQYSSRKQVDANVHAVTKNAAFRVHENQNANFLLLTCPPFGTVQVHDPDLDFHARPNTTGARPALTLLLLLYSGNLNVRNANFRKFDTPDKRVLWWIKGYPAQTSNFDGAQQGIN